MLGVVIGNGKSRVGFNLDVLDKHDVLVFGCNALYRDFRPDILFARDSAMIEEIKANYDGDLAEFKKPHVSFWDQKVEIPQEMVLTGSVALWCMCHMPISDIFLLGFDPYPIGEDGKNNVYTSTQNYGTLAEKAGPRTTQCIKDLQFVFSNFKDKNFYRVGDRRPVVNVKLDWDCVTYMQFLSIIGMLT